MNRDWILREPRSEEDWQQATELLFSVYVKEGFTPLERAARFFSRDYLEGNGDLILAAEAKGRVLGTVFLVNTSSELRQIAEPGESEFRMLAVARDVRDRGIGRQLVADCLRRATSTGARRMVLSTQPSMIAAHALYERLGFRRNPDRDWQTPDVGVRWVYAVDLDGDNATLKER